MAVVLVVRGMMSKEAFEAPWGGWRITFLLSIVLVAMSLYIRLRMRESPIFRQLKADGKTSPHPIRDALMAPGASREAYLDAVAREVALARGVLARGVLGDPPPFATVITPSPG